jgi:hypothetical protein
MTTKAKDKAPDRAGPLRVSTDPSDSGYKTWMETFGGNCAVVFNDVNLGDNVISADEETGEVVVFQVDQQGNFVVENGATVAVTLHGKVEIRKVDA